MDELIEKVKGTLQWHFEKAETECEGCPYAGREFCLDRVGEDAIASIKLLEEQNKELVSANDRLVQRLKEAPYALGLGVPPMPCDVGDPLWSVCELDGVISVEKVMCTEILWDGEDWLVSSDGCSWDVPGEDCVYLRIEDAVKRAEELLKSI